MVNAEIRLIIFFAVKDGEVLYRKQKQDWELTVAHIIKKAGESTIMYNSWRTQSNEDIQIFKI